MFWYLSYSLIGLQNYTFCLVSHGCDSNVCWGHSTACDKDVCKQLLGRIFGSEKEEVQKGGEIRKEWFRNLYSSPNFLFFMAQQPLVCQELLIIEGFMITHRRTTRGRTPLDEWSARRRDLNLTTHNTHNRQTSMRSVGFEPTSLSRRAAADPRLRPRGRWDRPENFYCNQVKDDEIYVECSLCTEFWLGSLKRKTAWDN